MSDELTIYEPDQGTPPGVGLTGFLQDVEACPWGEACSDCGGEIVTPDLTSEHRGNHRREETE